MTKQASKENAPGATNARGKVGAGEGQPQENYSTKPTPAELLKHALNYATRGWSVVALHTPTPNGCSCSEGSKCSSNGKHPRHDAELQPNGAHSATKDPEQVKRLWARWPDANVGIATGSNSGITVMDIDAKSGGHKSLRDLETKNAALPSTLIADTGGYGEHRIFSYVPAIKNKAGTFAPGVDFRNDGGLIVAAPSWHASGRRYAWRRDEKNTAPLPLWVIQRDAGDSWTLFTLGDAYAPRPPVEYLVDGIIELPSLNVVYGAPGSLKSLLLADLAVGVATGQAWLPALPKGANAALSTKQAPVLWVDLDNGKRRTHERFEAIGRSYNAPATTPLVYTSMPTPWLLANEADSVGDLIARAQRLRARLVVIDNLGQITGDVEESSPQMARVMGNLRVLAETVNCAVVVIHHQRKGNGLSTRAGESLRGSSAIEAALDLALLVERGEQAEVIQIKPTKTRGAEVPMLAAQFTYSHKEGTRELARAMFYGLESSDDFSDHAIKREILTALNDKHPLNQKQLVDAVKELLVDVGLNRIRDVIKRMAAAGTIEATSGKRGTQVYDLPAA